jgi:hypothetical protein
MDVNVTKTRVPKVEKPKEELPKVATTAVSETRVVNTVDQPNLDNVVGNANEATNQNVELKLAEDVAVTH